ncbi:DUF294 nucleotidyltransferase-like domain-containing protein [Candidatus Accumulibacter sp. ACC003]|uniref:DUF294 nucleotidyltransferase-like domain-containing protein n=1 Tax=Candidatus Accumulibacter sp. ACC003 TaxID=2823334 RepID=UPI0025BDCD1E|nr:DUF294 nucleotidyltransferase-like domain-containing protein [Candidatus Accumulibacter sp. ACC003]
MDVELVEVRDFLAEYPPFSTLDANLLNALPKMLSVRYLRRGSRFPPADETQPCLYLVRKGAVERRSSAGALLDTLCEGDLCAVDCLAEGESSIGTAIEDTLVYLLPCATLRALRREHATLDEYFVRSAAERLRLGRGALEPASQVRSSLLTLAVGAFVERQPVCGAPSLSIRQAAEIMTAERVSALLLVDAGKLCGIVTDRDLRARCLAAGVDSATPIARIMSSDVASIGPESAAFEALMLMTHKGIHHLPVVDAAGLRGLLSSTDLMRWQSANTVYLAGLVRKSEALGDLVRASAELPELQVRMQANGATPSQLGQAVSSVNDAITIRLIEITQWQLGPAPVPFAWVACGSQGRHEQSVHSDQDNALILDDRFVEQQHGAYFAALAQHVNDGLNACGYRYCPGKVMASNAAWRKPQSGWIQAFRGWIRQADTMAAMLAANFLDMRTVFGEAALLTPLHAAINAYCSRHDAFLARMVANTLKNKPPLGFFRNFTLIADGDHADAFDIKRGGLIPITDLARIHALAGGHAEIGTLARLRAAGGSPGLAAASAQELEEAFEYFGSLRLRHQVEQIRGGSTPDNFISPRSLTALEKNYLKQAFKVVGRMQDVLAQRYAAHRSQ